MKEKEVFVKNKAELWQWLLANYQSRESVWLVYYKQSSGKTDMAWSDIVDCCLCFGWIDSQTSKVDDERTKRRISPRNPKSGWSRINKEKVEKLTAAGLMQEAGKMAVAVAQQNGAWQKLDSVERIELPADLEKKLAREKKLAGWGAVAPSRRRMWLQQLLNMKGATTRARAIDNIIAGL